MKALPIQLIPSLVSALPQGCTPDKIPAYAMPLAPDFDPAFASAGARRPIQLVGERDASLWHPPEISTLFRGDVVPPPLETYPPDYVPLFAAIESRIHHVCSMWGMGRDEEIRELMSELRRRPDGRHRSALHEAFWRILVLVLASTPVSRAQYEAVVQRLSQSARSHSLGPSSRRYVEVLGRMFG